MKPTRMLPLQAAEPVATRTAAARAPRSQIAVAQHFLGLAGSVAKFVVRNRLVDFGGNDSGRAAKAAPHLARDVDEERGCELRMIAKNGVEGLLVDHIAGHILIGEDRPGPGSLVKQGHLADDRSPRQGGDARARLFIMAAEPDADAAAAE